MTAIQAIEKLLEDEWIEDSSEIDGRESDVPQPSIIREKNAGTRSVSLANSDYIFIIDGGRPTVEPRSVGWHEEFIEYFITLDIRTSHSRERLLGTRQPGNTAETYGGLSGEVKRIVDKHRRGWKEFDLVIADSFDDMNEQSGSGIWRGNWDIRLQQRANQIREQN